MGVGWKELQVRLAIRKGRGGFHPLLLVVAAFVTFVGLTVQMSFTGGEAQAATPTSVSFALQPSYHATNIFPLENGADGLAANSIYFSYLLYPQLYSYG